MSPSKWSYVVAATCVVAVVATTSDMHFDVLEVPQPEHRVRPYLDAAAEPSKPKHRVRPYTDEEGSTSWDDGEGLSPLNGEEDQDETEERNSHRRHERRHYSRRHYEHRGRARRRGDRRRSEREEYGEDKGHRDNEDRRGRRRSLKREDDVELDERRSMHIGRDKPAHTHAVERALRHRKIEAEKEAEREVDAEGSEEDEGEGSSDDDQDQDEEEEQDDRDSRRRESSDLDERRGRREARDGRKGSSDDKDPDDREVSDDQDDPSGADEARETDSGDDSDSEDDDVEKGKSDAERFKEGDADLSERPLHHKRRDSRGHRRRDDRSSHRYKRESGRHDRKGDHEGREGERARHRRRESRRAHRRHVHESAEHRSSPEMDERPSHHEGRADERRDHSSKVDHTRRKEDHSEGRSDRHRGHRRDHVRAGEGRGRRDEGMRHHEDRRSRHGHGRKREDKARRATHHHKEARHKRNMKVSVADLSERPGYGLPHEVAVVAKSRVARDGRGNLPGAMLKRHDDHYHNRPRHHHHPREHDEQNGDTEVTAMASGAAAHAETPVAHGAGAKDIIQAGKSGKKDSVVVPVASEQKELSPEEQWEQQIASQQAAAWLLQYGDYSVGKWDYSTKDNRNGPSAWQSLDSSFSLCGTGNHQSPIDITDDSIVLDSSLQKVKLKYELASDIDVHKSARALVVSLPHHSSSMVFDSVEYKLKQIHIHTPSEHRTNGTVHDAEVQLVHTDPISGRILIISVFFDTGDNDVCLDLFNAVISGSAPELNPAEIIPPGGEDHYYWYTGSVTTPPCFEGVQYIVMQKPRPMSRQALDQLKKIVGQNARPVQWVGRRGVFSKTDEASE